jgi:DNA-binding transcriptional LysR family regulator
MVKPILRANDYAGWFVSRRLKLRHLSVLLAVGRTHNIGRAAQDLHTSQPAVSKALQELERAAGVSLFERRPDGTVPTPAGAALMRYAGEVYGALERAGRELEAVASGLTGSLCVGCNFSSASFLVPKAVVLLKRNNPALSIQIQEGSLEMLIPQLRSRQLDLLVARWPRGRQIGDLEEQALFEQPMCVVCAPRHPLVGKKRISWRDLAAWSWIMPPQGSAVRGDLEELFRMQHIAPAETGIECASVFANVLLLRELNALTLCPQSVAEHLEAERLFAILPMKMPPVFGANSAIVLRGRERTPATLSFIDCLAEVAGAVRRKPRSVTEL